MTSITIKNSNRIQLKDKKVSEALNRLFEKEKYYIISKNANTIRFVIWTRGMDFGSGITYSINKIDYPTIEYLTKLEPLSEDGWYYYEADYSKWRTQH